MSDVKRPSGTVLCLGPVSGLTKQYRVRGIIDAEFECDCPSCEGHQMTRHVDKTVWAFDAQDAARWVLEDFEKKSSMTDADWRREPIIEESEIPESRRMSLIGATMLPGLTEVPNA